MTTIAPVKQIEELGKRLERARQLVAGGKVEPVLGADAHCIVRSEAAGSYLVNGHCTCEDARYRRDIHKGWCKHMLAVDGGDESERVRSLLHQGWSSPAASTSLRLSAGEWSHW